MFRRKKPRPKRAEGSSIKWQEWRGSNPQPPVLETGALPIELHSCRSKTWEHKLHTALTMKLITFVAAFFI